MGKVDQLVMPDKPENFDFWFTDETGTYGPLPCRLEKNKDKARRLNALNGTTVEIRPAAHGPARPKAKKSTQHTLLDVPDNRKPFSRF